MANMYINAMTDLWNSAGTTYSSVKMNVTNAASAAGSKLLDLQIASVPKFGVDKDGNVVAVGTLTSAGTVSSAAHLPSANDSAALGASGTAWSDLFLADGGVINWLAGDVTITHSSDQLLFGGAVNGYRFDAALRPLVADGAAIGSGLTPWSDLYLAAGGVVDFGGDVSITHATDQLILTGAASGYSFSHALLPTVSDGAALGSVSLAWSDLFLGSGAVVNFNNDVTLTHSTDVLTVAGGDLRMATAGTDSSSVVTVGGTQTLTSKTLTSPTITGATITGSTATFSGAVSAGGGITSTNASFTGSAGGINLGGTTTGGVVYLRPNGNASATGQAYLASNGTFVADSLYTTQNIQSAGHLVLGGSSGNIYFRPYGVANATYEAMIATDGGLRVGFVHTVPQGSPTHSFYNGGGLPGGGGYGCFIFGSGVANTAAGFFQTFPGAPVGANSHVYIGFHQASVNWWALYASGPVLLGSGYTTSDAKVKSNIKDCDCHDAYRMVRAIGVKSYRKEGIMSRNSVAYDEMGFLAQDIEPIIPEAVLDVPVPRNDEKGHALEPTESLKATNDRTLLATLWAAVQHQAELIERLEEKLAEEK